MGDGLHRELMDNRPYKPGPEWWLLLELAQDADDGTRRTACGYEHMAERTKAPRRTIYRWLAKLRKDGYIKVMENACPWVDPNGVMRFSSRPAGGAKGTRGRRAVYEIQIPAQVIERAAERLLRPDKTGDGCHRGAPVVQFVPDDGNRQNGRRVPPDYPDESQESGRRVPRMAPPLQDPLRTAPVEGAGLRPDQILISEEQGTSLVVAPERGARRALAAQAGPQPEQTETLMRPKRNKRPAA